VGVLVIYYRGLLDQVPASNALVVILRILYQYWYLTATL
jgi:hypothetical protein